MATKQEVLNAGAKLRNAIYSASQTVYFGASATSLAGLHAVVSRALQNLLPITAADPTASAYMAAVVACDLATAGVSARPATDATFRTALTAINQATAALNQALVAGRSAATIADPGGRPPEARFDLGPAPHALHTDGQLDLATLEVAPTIPHGRYEAASPDYAMELRYDSELIVLSVDFFRLSGAQRTWVASARSFSFSSGRFVIGAEDRYGATSAGWIEVSLSGTSSLAGRLRLDSRLDGLPYGRETPFAAELRGRFLRRLSLETEVEDGIKIDSKYPPSCKFRDAEMTIEAALGAAGIEVVAGGSQTKIDAAPQKGWSEKDIEAIMTDSAQIDLHARAFAMQLLWLSRSNRDGLLGVMFDTTDDRPRQSLAIFAGEIARLAPNDAARNRKLVQTSVHEIGHALNLAHRFERSVGRADSFSFMNYDWRFGGGNRTTDYWNGFKFEFDQDELLFLRHGSYASIVPGGAEFHSARYWSNGDGGYSPYVPERELPDLQLRILMPEKGAKFRFGEPVLLGMELKNTGSRALTLPRSVLDLKAGFVELLIRRAPLGRAAGGEPETFQPIASRCFDLTDSDKVTLPSNGTHSENMNLTFGASGFPFAEPGTYEIRALLVFHDANAGFDRIVASPPERITIGYPIQAGDDRVADLMFRKDVGRWLMLGGPARLEGVGDTLVNALKDLKTETKDQSLDNVSAHVLRAAMFGKERGGLVRKRNSFDRKAGDRAAARVLAQELTDTQLKCFDRVSKSETDSFIKGLSIDAPPKEATARKAKAS